MRSRYINNALYHHLTTSPSHPLTPTISTTFLNISPSQHLNPLHHDKEYSAPYAPQAVDKELLRFHPDVFRWRALRPPLDRTRDAHILRLQFRGVVHLLLQRHRGRRRRPQPSREVSAPDSLRRAVNTHGLHAHDSDVRARHRRGADAAARSDEQRDGCHRVLLRAQPRLLL